MLAPIGTQVQLRCSVVQGYSVQWFVTRPGGGAISSLEPGVLESIGFIPTSVTTQESMLAVNGTEDNSGTDIQCVAVLITDTTTRCPSEAVQVTFYGIPEYEHYYYTSYEIHTLTQVLPHHQLT